MKIKAIFMDMDGTLLNSNNLVSEKLKNKLQELEKKGIKIFIATGRSYAATSNYVREIGIKNPVITYNGGKIISPLTNEVIYENPTNPKNVEKLIKISRERKIHLNLYLDDRLYIEKESEEGVAYSKKSGMPYILESFDSFIGKSSTKGLFLAPNKVLFELKTELEKYMEDIYFVFSQSTYLEVLNKNVDKGFAVKSIMEKYSFSKDEVMAFGDQWNDFKMLKGVEYGYLMGNASDELKKEFPKNRITLSNNEDGIYHIIKNINV